MSGRDSIDDVLRVVSEHFAVTKTDILSTRRAHKVLTARRIGMYLALKTSGATAEEVGARFGGTDTPMS